MTSIFIIIVVVVIVLSDAILVGLSFPCSLAALALYFMLVTELKKPTLDIHILAGRLQSE